MSTQTRPQEKPHTHSETQEEGLLDEVIKATRSRTKPKPKRELSDREKIQATHTERCVYPAGTRRLIVIDKDAIKDFSAGDVAFPAIVVEPSSGHRGHYQSVQIKGESRVVPFTDERTVCGVKQVNHVAIETEGEVVGCDLASD